MLSEMKKTDDELEKTGHSDPAQDLTSTDDAIMKSLDELIAKMEGKLWENLRLDLKGYTDN